jgi:hypothetical protein
MKNMNCEEFQDVLPQIIESGGNEEQEAHLKSCPACAILVQDLRYIADQAKLLLPMHDPNPRVWHNIQQSLRSEGLVSEGRMSRLGHITLPSQTKSWTPLGWAIALAAVIVLALVLVNYHPTNPNTQEATATPSVATQSEAADQELISQVSQQQPAVRAAYVDSMKSVNAYIADAKKAADENPNDVAAQRLLMDAYDQKAMLYEMGTVRALQ